MKIAALILSAGKGSRMGGNKSLLRFKGQTFLERVSNALRESTVCNEICVVTGFDHEKVSDEAHRLQLKAIFNPHSELGIMTSLQTGIKAIREENDAILVALVDQPLVDGEFIASFVEDFMVQNGRYSLARPYVHGKPGHPSLILREHFGAILHHEATDEGANFLFREHPEKVRKFDTENQTVITDIDTVDDLRGLMSTPAAPNGLPEKEL
jgi:molybdenum cofactor cytidylyltransferase